MTRKALTAVLCLLLAISAIAAAASSLWPTTSITKGSSSACTSSAASRGWPSSGERPSRVLLNRAADIADKVDFCDWSEDQWGVDVKKLGAQEWYDSLFRRLASWDVDFVKADDLCYRGDEIAMLRRAVDRAGRPIVLSSGKWGHVPRVRVPGFARPRKTGAKPEMSR